MDLYDNKYYRDVSDWEFRNQHFADDYGDLYKRVLEALRRERIGKATADEFTQLSLEIRGLKPAQHSRDFRSLTWSGVKHEFTATQARCIRVLYEAWKNGSP